MIKFNNPLIFLSLIIILLFIILKKTNVIKPTSLNLNIVNWKGTVPKPSLFIKISNMFFYAFFSIGILTMIIALAEPIIFKTEAVYANSGNSIMFLIDISPSMAAKDTNGKTRLDNAKKIIEKFIEKYPGDSFGISALASSAALIVPPTIDHSVFLSRLKSLSIGELGDGTAIGMGLAVSALYSSKEKNHSSYIILLTDGENNTGEINIKTAAQILVEKSITFFVIGIGTSGYFAIEYTDKKTGKSYSGTLPSKFNPRQLKLIANYGRGKYSSANSTEMLEEIFNTISKTVPATQSTFNKTVEKKLYRYFLNITVLCFAIAWIIRRVVMRLVL